MNGGSQQGFEDLLADRVRRHPFGTVGAAAGLGYVLGGGMRSQVTALALGAITRLGVAWLLRELTAPVQWTAQAPIRHPYPGRR